MSCLPIATQPEAEAGTVNDKPMTPLRVKQAIDALGVSQDVLASSAGADMVGFEQAGNNTAPRLLSDKFKETVSIADYNNLHPDDDALDVQTAIHAAMKYMMDRHGGDSNFFPAGPGEPTPGGMVDFTRRDRMTGKIHIPGDCYRVPPKVFSSLVHARAPFVGFAFVGEGKRSSIFLLETGGVDSWFYDNGTDNQRYQWMLFRDLGFRADDWAKGSFAKLYSTGGPKQFHIDNCEFSNMLRYLWTEGTGNADLNRTTNSNLDLYGDMLTLNNSQSVQHDFIGNHYRLWGNWVRVMQQGGGNVNISHGSADHIWDSRFSPAEGNFMFTQDVDANIGQGNCTFDYSHLRVEVEAVTDKPGNRALTNAAGYSIGINTVALASGGAGAIAVDDIVQFGNDPTRYVVTSGNADISSGGSISFTPDLLHAIPASATAVYVNDPPHGIVKTEDFPNEAFPRISLDTVNFVNGRTQLTDGSGSVLSQAYRRITAFHVFPRKFISVTNSVLLKNFFVQKGGSRDTGSPNIGGMLLLEKCFDGINGELPAADASNTLMRFLHQRVKRIPGSSAGRVVTRDTVDHTGGSSFVIRLLDHDPDWRLAIAGEPSAQERTRSIKHPNNGFPLPAGGNEIVIEIGADITDGAVYFDKRAFGSSTASYQLHFGPTDRSISIFSSASGDFKDRHTIYEEHINIPAGVYRVWATGDATSFQNGGVGWIRCI